ncbi:MAG: DUF4245 family protein [Nocardioides sp.]|uniref:DUF4245 family protein n=1 Tax=Nocardioides sp. TaxID=35761 RepID=UPI0039E4DB99
MNHPTDESTDRQEGEGAGAAGRPGEPAGQEPEQGSRRYPRTFGGLIGSMIVLVALVVPIVLVTHWWGDANRDQANREAGVSGPGEDWRSAVLAVQQARSEDDGSTVLTPVYPRSLPSGWYANTVPSYSPGTHPSWGMNFTDGSSGYVGLVLAHGSARNVATGTIDANPVKGRTVTIDTEVGSTWTTWSDGGGDHGYSTTVAGDTLLLWGPREADLRTFLGLLTTEPLADAGRSAQPSASASG